MKITELDSLETIGDEDYFVIDGSAGTRRIKAKNLPYACRALTSNVLSRSSSYATNITTMKTLSASTVPAGTDSWHNHIANNTMFRGKNLGTSITTAQWNTIKSGAFDDMWIGDYWSIGGYTWRIAAFDYGWNNHFACTSTFASAYSGHWVTLIPDQIVEPSKFASAGTLTYGNGWNVVKTNLSTVYGTYISGLFDSSHMKRVPRYSASNSLVYMEGVDYVTYTQMNYGDALSFHCGPGNDASSSIYGILHMLNYPQIPYPLFILAPEYVQANNRDAVIAAGISNQQVSIPWVGSDNVALFMYLEDGSLRPGGASGTLSCVRVAVHVG